MASRSFHLDLLFPQRWVGDAPKVSSNPTGVVLLYRCDDCTAELHLDTTTSPRIDSPVPKNPFPGCILGRLDPATLGTPVSSLCLCSRSRYERGEEFE